MANKLTYLDYEQAIQKSLELAQSTKNTQHLCLDQALGRVLAEDIICTKNLPAFNNSAMDGFAYKYENSGKTLKIKQSIYAGDKGIKPCLGDDECYRIMTGAFVPSDVDTIAPLELCTDVAYNSAQMPQDLKKGSNLRLCGEEKQKGSTLLKKGQVLSSSSIALLASQGITSVKVYKKLSIAILSTGNELKEPWEACAEDEIYNCNSYAIKSLLNEHGFEPDYCGLLPDDLEKSVEFIKNLKDYDVIITSGGISFGDADFIYDAFLQNGLRVGFHGVNIKPGKPIMIGSMEKSYVISLPGNPLSAVVNMRLFGLNALAKIQGEQAFYHDGILAKNTEEFKVKQGRVNIVLGNLQNGKFTVAHHNKYGSGMISLLSQSNALLVSNANTSLIKKDQEVFVLSFAKHTTKAKHNILN